MKLLKLRHGVYQVDFESREALLKTFLRPQEYYESPEFKGKVFTLDEYKAWYQESRGADTFTYYSDWSGCNVPSYIFKDFKEGKFDPLSSQELALLKLLKTIKEQTFYVIGTFNGGSKSVLEHEILHGLYYTTPVYKAGIDLLLEVNKESLVDLKDHIRSLGYHESVVLDEVQAYAGASSEYLDDMGIKYPKSLTAKIQKLKELYGN